jgi:signal transduction histidine kinase
MATSPGNDDPYYLSVTKLLGIGFANSLDLREKDREPVLLSELERVAELNHRINSPLAAIRNSLYLAAKRTHDQELLRYLELADQEVNSISRALEEARRAAGEVVLRQSYPPRPGNGKSVAA